MTLSLTHWVDNLLILEHKEQPFPRDPWPLRPLIKVHADFWIETWDIGDTDFNSDNWEHEREILDSIRNSWFGAQLKCGVMKQTLQLRCLLHDTTNQESISAVIPIFQYTWVAGAAPIYSWCRGAACAGWNPDNTPTRTLKAHFTFSSLSTFWFFDINEQSLIETCDLWDIWSGWWGDKTWPKKHLLKYLNKE